MLVTNTNNIKNINLYYMKNIINLLFRYVVYYLITLTVKLRGDIKEQIEFKEDFLDLMFNDGDD
jgi:hypothetical protein